MDTAASRWQDPLVGTDYAASKLIGRGGMGAIFEATHKKLGKPVAVKILEPRFVDSQHGGTASLVERLRYEAQAASRIDDPRLVQVFDMDVTPGGRVFYVMELLAGCSLQQELKSRGALPVREARTIMIEVLEGLAALHREGLIHRDIKPSNIFYCQAKPHQSRRIKLLDFGLLKPAPAAPAGGVSAGLQPISAPTEPGMLVGTPRYCSPEQARGAAIDHRADIYAAGLVLYQMLAGRGPFAEHQGLGDILMAQLQQRPKPPSLHAAQSLPSELDAIVLQAIEKRPEDRFASASEFAGALRAAQLQPLPSRVGSGDDKAPLPEHTEPITEPMDETDPMAAPAAAPGAAPAPGPIAPPTVPLSEGELTLMMAQARNKLGGPTRRPKRRTADSQPNSQPNRQRSAEPGAQAEPEPPPAPGRWLAQPLVMWIAIGTLILVILLALWAVAPGAAP